MISGKLILLIDDDPVSNYLNLRLINSLNVAKEIKVFLNGKEALDFLILLNKDNDRVPDLILLDLNMPVMDGFDFLRAFKGLSFSLRNRINIIMMSISLNLSIIQKIDLAGYCSVEKPLTKEKLMKIFNNIFATI